MTLAVVVVIVAPVTALNNAMAQTKSEKCVLRATRGAVGGAKLAEKPDAELPRVQLSAAHGVRL